MTNERQLSEDLQIIYDVLDRQNGIDPLSALISTFAKEDDGIALSDIAIGIDANVFLRISSHRKSDGIIDYLSVRHTAPIILPGQAIQEFWNNQLNAVDTTSQIEKSWKHLETEINKLEEDHEEWQKKMLSLIGEFSSDHSVVYSTTTVRKTIKLLETLKKIAIVPFAPRTIFYELVNHRKMTRTPPGFKDRGDGDFFVWVDFLYGLLQQKKQGHIFKKAILVTNDVKNDWSRDGNAHPILVAEVKAILDVSFETLTLDELSMKIENYSE